MKSARWLVLLVVIGLGMGTDGCEDEDDKYKPAEAAVEVAAGTDGLTTEQRNIKKRLENDNRPWAIKHLYGLSPFTGDVLLYSTVDGKVTSGGKRLSPSQIDRSGNSISYTPEVIGDDGAYGQSIEYLYWFDTNGRYFQVYPQGMVILLSEEPLALPANKIQMVLR